MSTDQKGPYFDGSRLPNSTEAYVAWIDLMGIRGWMLRSLPVTANFVFKLHVAALEAREPDMVLYPVMDGVYAVASKDKMRPFLMNLFKRLALSFSQTLEHEHQFLIKGAIAFGPVIHGSSVKGASRALDDNSIYRDSILLGMPMVLAHLNEPSAPPFGIAVHDSARSFMNSSELKRSHCWWHWFEKGRSPEAMNLKEGLSNYFSWCESRAGALDYDVSRIKIHRMQASQYLVDAE